MLYSADSFGAAVIDSISGKSIIGKHNKRSQDTPIASVCVVDSFAGPLPTYASGTDPPVEAGSSS